MGIYTQIYINLKLNENIQEEAFNCWFKNKLIEAKKLTGLQGAEYLESFYERNYNDYLTGKK